MKKYFVLMTIIAGLFVSCTTPAPSTESTEANTVEIVMDSLAVDSSAVDSIVVD